MGLLIIYLTLALAVSFICSIAEAVILSVSVSYIRIKEIEGRAGAALLKRLKARIDKPLAAILSVNTVAHTIGAAGVGAQAVAVFGEIYFGIISVILTICILVFSEIIPKTIGARYWRSLALPFSRVIIFMVYISFPLVILSEFITRLITRRKKMVHMSREEIAAFAHLGRKEGVLEESESKIIDNLIRLRNIRVKSIMTPRTVVVAVSDTTPLFDFIRNKEYLKFSRIPVFSGSIDNISGYILNSEVLEIIAKDKRNVSLNDIKRPILVFYENLPLPKLFEEFLVKKEHIAAIMNEYGGFEGLVSMEDIIETILGLEIIDEKDTEDDMQKLAIKRWERRKKDLNIGLNDEKEK